MQFVCCLIPFSTMELMHCFRPVLSDRSTYFHRCFRTSGRCYLSIGEIGLMTSFLLVVLTSSCFPAVSAAAAAGVHSNSSVLPSGEVSEYCEGQTFAARCANPDEVVVMISAHYGRMRLGRCLAINYGNLGCQLDVLTQFDAWCSGQRRCDVRVSSIIDSLPDSGNAFPCIRDFRGYLEASYRCVKVVSAQKDECARSKSIQVTAEPKSERHLASVVTEETGCGSLDTPWQLRAPPGHKFRLHLIDFETAARTAGRPPGSHGQIPHVCQVYAVIKETSSSRAGGGETVCGSDSRYSHVYSSLSNIVEIRIVAARKNHKSEHFLLKYEVIGCTDLTSSSPTDVTAPHWMSREGDVAIFGCNGTSETWQLRCDGDQWIGTRRNCTPTLPAAEKHDYNYTVWSVFTGSQWAAILIILAMAVAVGMVIFFVGLLYIRRRRLRDTLRSRTYIDAGGSLCGDYHLGQHCSGDHHHHHHQSQPTGLLLPTKNSISNSNSVFPPLGGGSLISPSGCSTGGQESGSGDAPPPTSATSTGMPYLPGCAAGQTPSSAENDYFRTWQLQRHAASRVGGAPYPGSRSGSSLRGPQPAVGSLFLDSSSNTHSPPSHLVSGGRSPPEHIYESPKFERRDFVPPSSQQQHEQPDLATPLQHQCICCAATTTSPAAAAAAAAFMVHNRCSNQTCGGIGGGPIQYYDLDPNETSPRM